MGGLCNSIPSGDNKRNTSLHGHESQHTSRPCSKLALIKAATRRVLEIAKEETMMETPTKTQPATAAIEPLQVDVVEAARLLAVSRSTIYAMLNSGELPSTRRGMVRRIPIAALRAWIDAHLEHSS
jgi:excisionase family DNA binding protein